MEAHFAEEFTRAPCKDAALCADCVGVFEKRAVAADRARIAAAIREEMPASDDPDGLRWRFGDGSAIDGGDVMGLLERLLRVVEGGA